MSQAPYESAPSWTWPKEVPPGPSFFEEDIPLPGAYAFDSTEPKEEPVAQEAPPQKPDESPKPKTQRNYAPRTCRICLEVVNPTFEPAPDGIPSMFSPAPQVQYISEDPSSGRLLRPCKCSGTGRYVHEGCLQEWRHADKQYGRRNYWECPTCKFRYHLERMRWSRWLSSTFLQLFLTVTIMLLTIFAFGFVADPIINLYLDPYDTITSIPSQKLSDFHLESEDGSWAEHFLKGVASLGLLGFVKAFFAMSPWHWWNLRQTGVLGGGRARRGGTGRDRLENISWGLVIIGIMTFLYGVWKFVRSWSRRTLEKASERVVDIQGDDDDYEEVPIDTASDAQSESRKTQ